MLYISTRNNKDAYTAYRALHENAAPDGGGFIPFRMPSFSVKEINKLTAQSFGQTVAELLNRFFSCKLSGWDVDFCIGRNAIKLATMPHRLIVAEMWHNPAGIYNHIVDNLFAKISESAEPATDWFKIAAHISVLFGIYTEMCRCNIITCGEQLDFTATADDLTIPIAAIYARQMGLPIDTVVITCEENSGLWEFIHLGELSGSQPAAGDVGYERLVHTMLGNAGVNELCKAIQTKRSFSIDIETSPDFSKGLFCSVTGSARSAQNINSIYRSNAYLLDPIAAKSIGGLQDYRAKTGESKNTLVISALSPINCVSQITEATGIAAERVRTYLEEPQIRR